MAMSIVNLLAHLPENKMSAIAREIEKYGANSGCAVHILDRCVFQPMGMTRSEWLSRPYFIFMGNVEAWQQQSAQAHSWQKTLAPEPEKPIEAKSHITRVIRG
jgi:hypothetical protein